MSKDWVVPGAEVVLITHDSHYGYTSARRTTIARVGKRDVVLENGSRVNVETLRQSDPYRYSTRHTYLVPAGHEDVEKALFDIRRKVKRNKARTTADSFFSGYVDAVSLDDVIEAFEALREFEPDFKED